MSKYRGAAERRGTLTRDELREREKKHREESNAGRNNLKDLRDGVKKFAESRGGAFQSGQWGGKPKVGPPIQTPAEPKPAPVNKWVSRGTQPPLPPRYTDKHQTLVRIGIITNAKAIVAAAERKGLVTRARPDLGLASEYSNKDRQA